MQITDLSYIDDAYDHIYLAPHLDDAVLSCGGAIIRQRQAGERVLVVTLCTAAPAAEGPFSALAQEFHRQWALDPEQAIAARLNEEVLAMQRVGADYYWAGMLDAIYRYPLAYHSRATLFGTPAPDDPLLPALRQFIQALRDRVPRAALYAPLGVGNHVDHQITYAAVLDSAGGTVMFYEDFPYVAKPGALEQRLAALGGHFQARTIPIDATLAQKIDVSRAYASQLVEVFGGLAAMERTVADYAHACRSDAGEYAERLWVQSE